MWGWIWPRTRIEDGAAYERYVGGLLRKCGWTVQHIGGAGDCGVDLIATRGKKRVAVQCKWRADPYTSVGNGGVQEVHCGMQVHGCSAGVVVTNGWFTRGARKVASATETILLKDDEISKLRGMVGARRKVPWEVWAMAAAVVIAVGDLAWATRPAWHKMGVEARFVPLPPRVIRDDTTSVGGPSPIRPPAGIRVGLPEGSLVLRCVRWGEAEHGREERARGKVLGYDALFQRCMNDGSLLDDSGLAKAEPKVQMGPEAVPVPPARPADLNEPLLVEKAVKQRCDEMNDRKCGGV
jgi:hypothetical protein